MPIIEKARFAMFYDTGFVNAASWDFNTNDLVSDIGIGLRLDLPIGPIRIDYGIPIQKDRVRQTAANSTLTSVINFERMMGVAV